MLALWEYSSFLDLVEKELYRYRARAVVYIVTRAFGDALELIYNDSSALFLCPFGS